MHTDVQILVYYYINLRMPVILHTYTHILLVLHLQFSRSEAKNTDVILKLHLFNSFSLSAFDLAYFVVVFSCIVFLFLLLLLFCEFYLYFHRSFPYGGIC